MKFMKYRGWEIYFFDQTLGGNLNYYCSAPEINAIHTGWSYWEAFLRIRQELDDIQNMMELEVDDADVDETECGSPDNPPF